MKKGNFIRLIVWGSIWLIIFIAGTIGIISYNTGYGVIGRITHKTKPIVEIFNNLNNLERYSAVGIDIKAKTKKDTIEVVYSTISEELVYIFKYEKLANEDVLMFTYKNTEASTARLITEFMIDSISISKGHKEGQVFEKYHLNDFEDTSIDQGIVIKDEISQKTVYLNINKSILEGNIITEDDRRNEFLSKANNILQKTKGYYNTEYFTFEQNTCQSMKSLEGIEENLSYYIDVTSTGNYRYFIVASDTYAYTTNTETLNEVDRNFIISKEESEEEYSTLVNRIKNKCKTLTLPETEKENTETTIPNDKNNQTENNSNTNISNDDVSVEDESSQNTNKNTNENQSSETTLPNLNNQTTENSEEQQD